MPRLGRAVLALSAAPVLATKNSAIGKVIDLLKDMQGQVEEETKKGAAEAEATENQCIADISKLEGDVKYTGEKAEEAAAAKEEGAAKAATYAGEADKLVPEIASAEAAKKDAKKAFNKEAAAFAAEEAEMTEAVSMLTSAYSVLEKSLGGSFLQGSSKTMSAGMAASSTTAKQVVTALRSVVDAAWLDASSPNAQQLKAFVQEQENAGDSSLASALSLAQQPAAPAVKAYESKSGGILDAIAGMQEKAESELAGLKEKALKSKHAYELLSQDLTSKIELKTEQMEAAKTSSAEFTASSEKGAAELAEASESLDSYKATLTDTKAGCTKAAEDWAARSAEAGEEVAAIAKAVEILSGKFAPAPEGEAFIQMAARVKGSSKKFLGAAQPTDFEARAKAASLLRRMGETFSNFQFLQAATAVSSSSGADPFKKVRKMITDMISKLEDEQAEEAAKEGKCVADKAKGKKDIKVKGTQLKQLQARADKANAKVSELATDLSELADEVKGLDASRAGWTKERNASKSENTATIKEAAESVEALNAAISALEEFYGSGAEAPSFLQVATGTKKLSDKAEAIISILQTAQSDFEKLKQATEKSEADAASSYEKDMQASEVSLAKAKATIEGKTSEQATVKAQITQIDEDLTNAQKAFEAASSFLKSVNEACANKPMTFEEKQAKRKSEIEGLKTAFSILSGE